MSRVGRPGVGILVALLIGGLLTTSFIINVFKFSADTVIAAAGSAAACQQQDGSTILAVDQENFSGNPAGLLPDQVAVLNTGAGVAFAHKELSPKDRLHLTRILLSVGLVESEAKNVRYGHATSLGWIQLQEWWGTVAQRTDVAISAELFISGGAILSRLFNGRPDTSEPGALDIKGWQTMPAGEVAWRVQQPREDLRWKYAARLPQVDRFLAGKTPSTTDPNTERARTSSTGETAWSENCTGVDPAGLGTKDGFTFPVAASQAVIKKGVSYNNATWTWCYNSLTSCHHDYIAADIHAPLGTTVVAAMAGVVVKAVNTTACSGASDLDVPRITIRDPRTNLHYFYTHLMPGSISLKAGQRVTAGQPIGKVGPAECAQNTGPHLHIHATRGPNGRTDEPSVRARMVDLQPLLVGAFNQIGLSKTGGWALPVKGVITSCYGMRFHPVYLEYKMHGGTDFDVTMGEPIRTVSSGVVVDVGFQSARGREVVVQHGPELFTRYQHLSRTAVIKGQTVKTGDIVGYGGSTGVSTGPHLHIAALTNYRTDETINFEALLVSKGVRLPEKVGKNC